MAPIFWCALVVYATSVYTTLFSTRILTVLPSQEVVPFALSVIAFGLLVLFLYSLFNHLNVAVVLGTFLIAIWNFANQIKFQYLASLIQPLDLFNLAEFTPYATKYLDTVTLFWLVGMVAFVVVLTAWMIRRPSFPQRWGVRVLTLVASVALLGSLSWSLGQESLRNQWSRVGIGELNWNPVKSVMLNGVILEFLSQVPKVMIFSPKGYSEESVAAVLERRKLLSVPAESNHEPVDLVLYFMESTINPDQLGLTTTSEARPNFHRLSQQHTSGYVFVPDRYRGSGNSEFETFTGMTHFFLPPNSTPYKQLVKRPIPTLITALKEKGYEAHGVQSDHDWMYNRPQVYPLMGFDTNISYSNLPRAPKEPSGRYIADEILGSVVVERLVHGTAPKVVFVFPNATHSPYNYKSYSGSDLKVLTGLEGNEPELNVWINAMRYADHAFGKTLSAISKLNRRVIVVALGDHWPPFSFNPELDRRLTDRGVEAWNSTHKTPLLIWSNFARPKETVEMSLNMLGGYLFKQLGYEPQGLMALTEQLRKEAPVVSSFVRTADGKSFPKESPPKALQPLLADYQMLQYDLLLGKQYAVKASRAFPIRKLAETPSQSRAE